MARDPNRSGATIAGSSSRKPQQLVTKSKLGIEPVNFVDQRRPHLTHVVKRRQSDVSLDVCARGDHGDFLICAMTSGHLERRRTGKPPPGLVAVGWISLVEPATECGGGRRCQLQGVDTVVRHAGMTSDTASFDFPHGDSARPQGGTKIRAI